MKKIQIQAQPFFETLKLRDHSMWDLFAQLIDGEEKELQFLDEQNEVLFAYILPKTLEQMQEDRTIFAKEFSEKISK